MKKTFAGLLFLSVLISCGDSKNNEFGTVKGKLCYPSEMVPALDLFFMNIETKEVIVKHTKDNTQSYSYKDIPVGKYNVYAYEPREESEMGAGYTNYVVCGMKESCSDHKLTIVEVKPNQITKNVDICDWYGAIIPKKK